MAFLAFTTDVAACSWLAWRGDDATNGARGRDEKLPRAVAAAPSARRHSCARPSKTVWLPSYLTSHERESLSRDRLLCETLTRRLPMLRSVDARTEASATESDPRCCAAREYAFVRRAR